ncbi:hypothetical protein CFC21_102764 [Triticum aestivum]|uniref:Uncharacterized protein n=3 Tax=Triticum TaxID=4564 RepID=A0A9R1BZN0_TRITD|nr:hypothetical protein CFC21_102764 [Triticum aestivum]VAI86926.1 unnamed protein product [Triticum turgidum subsp. durum]
MSNSSTCNCSSLHVTLLFWDALGTRDHLLEFGAAICFDRSSTEDSIVVTATSLALANRQTILQLSTSAGEEFLLVFLNCFCAFLVRRNQDWILA